MGSRLLLAAGVLMTGAALGLFAVGLGTGGLAPVGKGAMGGWGFGPGLGSHIDMDRAVQIAQNVAQGYPGNRLAVDEVMEFADNYYASIREADTRIGAFEILIDKSTGRAMPEPGPNMMWNTKYGMMSGGGMMGSVAQPGGFMSLSSEQAARTAQQWLDSTHPGTKVRKPDPFYGYYTLDFEKGGRLVGMLSVNGYTGQV